MKKELFTLAKYIAESIHRQWPGTSFMVSENSQKYRVEIVSEISEPSEMAVRVCMERNIVQISKKRLMEIDFPEGVMYYILWGFAHLDVLNENPTDPIRHTTLDEMIRTDILALQAILDNQPDTPTETVVKIYDNVFKDLTGSNLNPENKQRISNFYDLFTKNQ